MLKKINVIGSSGSGKSTFSRKLSKIYSFEHIEMDQLFWGKDWQPVSKEDFLSKVEIAMKGDAWVLDGNYSNTSSFKWKVVDTVIWIDYSFLRTMYQAIGRALNRIITQKEIWPGTDNKETIKRSFFSKDSILLWTIKTYSKNKKKYELLMQNNIHTHIKFIRLRSPKECSRFLYDLSAEKKSS